jgi:carboxymethylenebutenolidase
MSSKADLDRRSFIAGAAGYAIAVSPITAWAINTSTDGLETQTVDIAVDGAKIPAYVARPKQAGKYPAIVVIHEIFGVHEYIRDICRRLAKAGYLAIAPDLFFRHGDATKVSDIETLRKTIVSKATQKQVLSDLDAVVSWLGKREDFKKDSVGITGFCWGGNATWMYAAHNPKISAGVAWYGRLSGDATSEQPKFPLDIASTLKPPVLGLYGEKDKGIPLDQVEKMKTELAKGKSGSLIKVYAGAEHGFHADYRPAFNPKAAEEAWGEMLGWFKKHLG